MCFGCNCVLAFWIGVGKFAGLDNLPRHAGT